MGARMLGKFSKPGKDHPSPNCARTKAATTAERPQHANRRRDGGTAPGPRRRARARTTQPATSRRQRAVADRLRRRARISLLAGAAALAAVSVGPTAASAATYPPGFSEQTVFTGLANPIGRAVLASDGRVFVAEKNGRIKVFDSLTDTTPTVFADLNVNVYNFWDRGLLGLALAPNFPTNPYVYVLYTYDHELGSTAPAPRWGTPGVLSDPCPTPPGPTADGCVVSGRLSRLQASGNVMTGPEQVLIEDWCQQYPSHSIGALDFGPDGALYVTGGDGASFNFADWGQDGAPLNPCGDPPGGVGAMLTPPTAEGGALRSQDLRTPGDPTSLDGALLRVDPATGAGLPDNPNAASPDANARRIVAYGLRNPFRFAVRPGTERGMDRGRRLEHMGGDPTGSPDRRPPRWSTSAGRATRALGRQSGYDGANLNICENLYAQGPGAVQAPLLRLEPQRAGRAGRNLSHRQLVRRRHRLRAARTATTRASTAARCSSPTTRATASGRCSPASNGVPDPARIRTFAAGAANPVELQIGPGGDLFYPDFDGGTIRRVTYTSTNQPPIAAITASPTTGPAPLFVSFDGTASSDPEGRPLSYAWDLNGDGTFGDATGSTATYTYSIARRLYRESAGHRRPGRERHGLGHHHRGQHTPDGDHRHPSGRHNLEGRRRHQLLRTRHRRTGRHAARLRPHLETDPCSTARPTATPTPLQTFAGVASGSFTAPDHEYPSYLELELTATDSGGLTDTKTIRLDPRTVTLTFSSIPGGLRLAVNGTEGTATFTRTVIVGSTNTSVGHHTADQGQEELRLLVMVRRRRPNPHHHRSGHKRHLHSPLQVSHRRGGGGPAPPRPELDTQISIGSTVFSPPASPVLSVSRGSISSTCVSSSAFGQCSTPFGTTNSSPGPSTTSRSRSWIVSSPATGRGRSRRSRRACARRTRRRPSRRAACSRSGSRSSPGW